MNKKELLYWKNKYEQEYEPYNANVENELRYKFQQNRYVTKEDLKRIIMWKFQGKLLGRQKIFMNKLKIEKDSFIKDVSCLALKQKGDIERLKMLCIINGIGISLASVILTFYDCKNYGILDIHSWRGLFNEKEPKNIFLNKHAIRFFKRLRKISNKTNLSCRDIEKAFFKKDITKKN